MKTEYDRLILSINDYVKNDPKAYINNVDEAMLEYYRIFAKKMKPLPPEPEWSDFYHPSEAQEKWWIIICCSGYR